MKVTHFLGPKNKISKEVNGASFLISNNMGDYLWLDEQTKSRYQGWFCRIADKMFRIIEGFEIEGGGKVKEVQNGFNHIERKRENITEIFRLPSSSHTLIYELSEEKKVDVFLDVRESYSSAETKDYIFQKEEGFLTLRFYNNLFLAVKCEDGENIALLENRHYEYDESRNSPPFNRNVYRGISLIGKKFVFGVGESKKEAIEETEKEISKRAFKENEKIDILCAKKSLEELLVENEPGIYAGLPWFFHFWPRDEAISLKSLIKINPSKAKQIFFRLLSTGLEKGPGGVINIDAVGWLFKRAEDILPVSDVAEKEKIRRFLKKYLEDFLLFFTENGFAVNRSNETWMDSLERSGARIELQAMKLNMYKIARILSSKRSEKDFYGRMEGEMKQKVKNVFFDGENLYDGYYPHEDNVEKEIRPNIFIAAYIYPELLQKKEWIKCFDNALNKLWLPWGGIATLDKDNENFCWEHTGENSQSYHQGDSWFYINNLTVCVLSRFGKRRYSGYIKKIMQASQEEILWMGAVGSHAEVSSAKTLESRGAVSQAWSAAMYLEAKERIKRLL